MWLGAVVPAMTKCIPNRLGLRLRTAAADYVEYGGTREHQDRRHGRPCADRVRGPRPARPPRPLGHAPRPLGTARRQGRPWRAAARGAGPRGRGGDRADARLRPPAQHARDALAARPHRARVRLRRDRDRRGLALARARRPRLGGRDLASARPLRRLAYATRPRRHAYSAVRERSASKRARSPQSASSSGGSSISRGASSRSSSISTSSPCTTPACLRIAFVSPSTDCPP